MRQYGGVSADDRVAARRSQLLDAALELYGTRGYAATGVKDVCRAAGLTDRYFYESFANSGELFVATFERATGELFAAVATAVVAAAAEREAQARAAVDSFVRALAADPRKARLLFVEIASVGGDAAASVRESTRRFADLIAATARPHLDADVPERLVTMGALSLVGAMASVLIEWLDGNLDATMEEVVDHFVDLLLVASEAAERTTRSRGNA